MMLSFPKVNRTFMDVVRKDMYNIVQPIWCPWKIPLVPAYFRKSL